MELNREFTKHRSILQDGVQSSADYTLPDYQGDVRRILYSTAEVADGGRFQNADSLDCVGTVTYKIVYIDAEGKITPVSFISDYEIGIKCPSESYIDSDVRTRVANFSIRLMGPRRFLAKCTLEAELGIAERAHYKVESELDECEIECLGKNISVASSAFASSAEREMAEELAMLDGAIVDEVETLVFRAEPISVSASRTDDGVTVRCQIATRALIATSGEAPRIYEGVSDFFENLPLDGISADAAVLPSVRILSENIALNPCDSGVSVVTSIIASASVRTIGNTGISLLSDCFSPSKELDLTRSEYAYTEHIGSKLISERYTASVPRSDVGAECLRNVLYESVKVRTESVSPSTSGVEISGYIQASAIACEIDEDGTPAYSPLKFETTFSINVNLDCHIPTNSRYLLDLSLDSPHIDVDESDLRLCGNISGTLTALCDKRSPCISAVSGAGAVLPRDPSVVSVYYPTAGETLFDVAKMFHIPPMELARTNEISEAVCTASGTASLIAGGVDYLLIK